ncbi:MAG: phosphoethanolamine--lipid A transferase [Sulfuricurvum sp.]|uniref:phosphoethanolamine transferase n=1 Tax=Sulfuricurvum sp. TaxID=2025608 RepID=UPI0027324436|nr:phosphoethanolamine--lipid A transferase [Sulfuricurvum sp.]MDP2851096.1 phosphoethanolamine--lipid A transferase [Sulfuricurvum sp.]
MRNLFFGDAVFTFFKSTQVLQWKVILTVAFFLTLVANTAFFKHVIDVYSLSWSTLPFIVSLAILLVSVCVILLTLLSWGRATKPLLIIILMASSFVAYFMDTYDVVIDAHMIENILQTNLNESADLFSVTLILYVALIGIIPSILIYRVSFRDEGIKAVLIEKAKLFGAALGIALVVLVVFNKNYTSFFREHKPLRYYANPAYYFYSVGHYVQKFLSHPYTGLQIIGKDAKISATDVDRELVILVVGEAARWDHFSLNGYSRETNPLLKKEDIINFSQFSSCGTETAVSVPCMFSSLTRDNYEGEKAGHIENVLDVIAHAGVNVLWRDNNSDSKGVALRATYEDYKSSDKNTMCEGGECRDEGMLVGLDEYIKSHPKGDIVIVLHQMGNHGPAYYKRYPKEFEKFTPVCKSNQLEQCSEQEITNAYDNAILYTDHFLSKTINFLKGHNDKFETAMFYVSDHGESLGEKGLYLHGFPYAIAPEVQKHVPAVMWFGKHFEVNKRKLREKAKEPLSHDSYFHTVLNFAEINSSVYQSELDILHGIH